MNDKITHNQYTAIILSSFIGVGIVSLASETSKKAHQCSWISILISGLFPLIMLLVASYVDKKMYHEDFSYILESLYGKFLGKLLLLIFLINAFLSQSLIISGYIKILKLSISVYMPSILILVLIILITMYTTTKKLTTLGRLCELSLYFTVPLLFLPLLYINFGHKTHLMPCFENAKAIVSAIPTSFNAYGGSEISFFLFASISNRKNTTKHNIFPALIVTLIYTFITAITVYFFGWKLTSKTDYSLLFVFKLVRPAIFSDFTSFFMIIWSTSILLTLSIEQFIMCYCLSKIFNLNYEKTLYIGIPFVLLLNLISIISNKFIVKILKPMFNYVLILIFIWCIVTFIVTFFKTRKTQGTEM
ncbi:GerAB/ArcD/ProY family transporter [Clostridium sp. MB40-C1]|uniref:GerAB/ArcD/ProY family transporter n=1 Tax=Clostridium sp. MB40-C1 TaxID=3070996 RepID=UPI0027DEC067|nr:GerAB/ArcD/ProY family transporter [Clostridium sp. MB40-C1]WMJ81155.1 GerAB/ArcD/ProY family transporter [Clostridium sp. MB40-C1]